MKYLMLLILVGCGAASPKMVYTPSGAQGYQIECKKNLEDCLSQAGEMCGSRGYTVVHSDSHTGGIAADWIPGPIDWYNITVQCGS